MKIRQAKRLLSHAYKDPALLGLYAEGDKLSNSQTKHDVNHAYEVRDVAIELTREINALIPGAMNRWTREIIIPFAAFLHDIGRAINVDNHAQAGAKWARPYLTKLGFDSATVRQITQIIACHRSSIVLKPTAFRKPNFQDAAWAIVVIADKAVGDEDRVRPEPLKELRKLRKENRVSEWTGSPHDRVNYAIKSSELIVDGRGHGSLDPGAIVLKLRIDPLVCDPSDIYTLYGDRFHACGRAAQYLGFLFRLEFNGVRYSYDKGQKTWVPVTTIKVTGRKH